MSEENNHDVDTLNKVLNEIVEQAPNISKAIIISLEGLIVPYRPFQSEDNLITLAAMGAAILSAGERVGNASKKAKWERMIIRGELRTVVVVSIGEDFALVMMANSSLEFKSLSYEGVAKYKFNPTDKATITKNLISTGERVNLELKLGKFEGFQFKFENDDYYLILKADRKNSIFHRIPTGYFELDFIETLLSSSNLQNKISKIREILYKN